MKVFALAASLLPLVALAAPMNDGKKMDDYKEDKHAGKGMINGGPFYFTSTYKAYATPDQVVNNVSVSAPGEPGAYGTFQYGINAPEEVICYNITVFISGNYSSPAKTATHIHQGAFGRAGPPRLAFPNPTSDSPIDEFGRRVSIGCMTGPFTTGILANGTDTGTGFSLSQIEANPPAFFTDTHTAAYLAGAIRGQLELDQTSY